MSEEWPTTFRIKSRDWEIQYVERLKDDGAEDPEDPENDLLGLCRVDLKIMYVSLDQSEESMRDTLVHELMHAVYFSMPRHQCEEEDAEKLEENWVLGATEAFFEIVRNSDDPWWL